MKVLDALVVSVCVIFSIVILVMLCSDHTHDPPTLPVDPIYRTGTPPPTWEARHRMDTIMSTRHAHLTPDLAHLISAAAYHHDIPYFTAFRLVDVESDFIPTATSWVGARGLTQVMPPTGAEHCNLGPDSLYLPSPNLHCGFSYLRMLYDRLGSWHEALASYNVGPTRRARAHLTGEPTGDSYAMRVLGTFK